MDGDVVGTGCFFDYGVVAWIGYVGVIPEYQRRGVGTAIMRELLSRLESRGIQTVRLDSTREGYGLYKKLGFIDEYDTIAYTLSEETICDDKVQSNVMILEALNDEVRILDKEAFGADRSKVIKAWVKRGARILYVKNRGYALVWRYKVGPVIAIDYEIAKALLCEAIKLGARQITIPEANRYSVELVKEFNGLEQTRCRRTRKGKEHRENVDLVYGILNYAKG